MAAVLTGTPVAINWAAGIDPAAQNITIPSDATAVYMMWAFDGVDANGHGLASVTLNGAAPDQTFEIPTAAGFFPASGVAAWYNPATGSQALNPAWDIAPVEGPVTIVAFVKDGDTTAWRDADADQDVDANAVSVTLTTVAGDLVLKFDQRFDGAENPPSLSTGWTNGATGGNVDEGCRLSYISASGTTQVCASEDESYSTIVAIAIAPSAGGTNGTANGVTLTATASIVAGAASAASTASGAASTATASLIAGSASATGDATASGVTLTATASLVPGAAAGSSPVGHVDGMTRRNRPGRGPYSLARYFRPRIDAITSAVDGTASGQTITATASLLAGVASADSQAPAVTLTAASSLVPGAAAAASSASGQTLTGTVSLLAGSAASASTAAGVTLTAACALIAGAASGAGEGTAAGVSLSATASLVAGAVSADAAAGAQSLAITASLIAGAASGGSDASGVTLLASASLIAGGVAADAQAQATVLSIASSFLAGAAQGNQPAELSEHYRYDTPGLSLRYDVPTIGA